MFSFDPHTNDDERSGQTGGHETAETIHVVAAKPPLIFLEFHKDMFAGIGMLEALMDWQGMIPCLKRAGLIDGDGDDVTIDMLRELAGRFKVAIEYGILLLARAQLDAKDMDEAKAYLESVAEEMNKRLSKHGRATEMSMDKALYLQEEQRKNPDLFTTDTLDVIFGDE